mmetsp:Transcript_418/g.1463  ORF Transcript_418/g.1463 Transcript_418/m.1463 type:complete len:228 (+) Transcript_418:887-1570(+)
MVVPVYNQLRNKSSKQAEQRSRCSNGHSPSQEHRTCKGTSESGCQIEHGNLHVTEIIVEVAAHSPDTKQVDHQVHHATMEPHRRHKAPTLPLSDNQVGVQSTHENKGVRPRPEEWVNIQRFERERAKHSLQYTVLRCAFLKVGGALVARTVIDGHLGNEDSCTGNDGEDHHPCSPFGDPYDHSTAYMVQVLMYPPLVRELHTCLHRRCGMISHPQRSSCAADLAKEL